MPFKFTLKFCATKEDYIYFILFLVLLTGLFWRLEISMKEHPLFHIPSSAPSHSERLHLPGFCSDFRFFAPIWRLELRNTEERRCGVCPSRSRLLHSVWSFVVPSIYQKFSRLHVFPCTWIVFPCMCGMCHILIIHSPFEGHLMFPFPDCWGSGLCEYCCTSLSRVQYWVHCACTTELCS